MLSNRYTTPYSRLDAGSRMMVKPWCPGKDAINFQTVERGLELPLRTSLDPSCREDGNRSHDILVGCAAMIVGGDRWLRLHQCVCPGAAGPGYLAGFSRLGPRFPCGG